MAPRWFVLLPFVAVLASACESTGALDRVDATPTPRERALLEDLKDGSFDHVSELEAALIVGGSRDPDETAATMATLDKRLAQIVQGVSGMSDPARRGHALLAALYSGTYGLPLLRNYDAQATTLYDVVTTGQYNCVSATILYVLAARRAGLEAHPVLLPSHARAIVVARDRRITVETTSGYGFDPPPAVLKEVMDRARPKTQSGRIDLYSDEKGTEVSFAALLAVAYGNLGVYLQEGGERELASAMLARQAALTPPDVLPLVRLAQTSLWTELATRSFEEGRLNDAMRFTRQAYDTSPDTPSKRRAEQNVVAIATRFLHAHQAELDDDRIAAFAEAVRDYPHAYGDVETEALTILARRRQQRGDVEGSAAALRKAARR